MNPRHLEFPVKAAATAIAAAMLAPMPYMASVAVLVSLHVHGCALPSRAFLKAYSGPSNLLVRTPLLGRAYRECYEHTARLVRADDMPEKPDTLVRADR